MNEYAQKESKKTTYCPVVKKRLADDGSKGTKQVHCGDHDITSQWEKQAIDNCFKELSCLVLLHHIFPPTAVFNLSS